MNRYAVASVVLLAAAGTGQAHAQAVVEEPGYCAQFYPNANCNNYGPGNPLYSNGYYAPSGPPAAYSSGRYAQAYPPIVRHRRYHHYR